MRTVRSENEAPVLAILPATDWLTLLPRFSPTARSMLRNRRDLDAEVSQALNSFGTADFGIAADAQLLAEELRPASPSTASDPVEPAKAKFANSWRVSTLSSAKAGSSPVWSGDRTRTIAYRISALEPASPEWVRPSPVLSAGNGGLA